MCKTNDFFDNPVLILEKELNPKKWSEMANISHHTFGKWDSLEKGLTEFIRERKYGIGRYRVSKSNDSDFRCEIYVNYQEENTMEPFKAGDQVYDIILGMIGTVIVVGSVVMVKFPSLSIQSYFENGNKDQMDRFRRLFHLGEPSFTFAIPVKPKKKVKAYKWVCKDGTGDFFVSHDYYRDDIAKLVLNHPVQRIDEAFIEVDE